MFLFMVDFGSLYTNIPVDANKRMKNSSSIPKNSPKCTFYYQNFWTCQEIGFVLLEGWKEEIKYWINQFDNLRKTTWICKWCFGNPVEYIDL